MSQFPIEDALKPECDSLRADLLAIEKRTRALEAKIAQAWDTAEGSPVEQLEEMSVNKNLAVRHVEDARMRIGKVLQYARDGVSCFDHTKETP